VVGDWVKFKSGANPININLLTYVEADLTVLKKVSIVQTEGNNDYFSIKGWYINKYIALNVKLR